VKVCVQGLWHLGTVTAAALASLGHQVTGLDYSPVVIDKLVLGEPPVFEPGLRELLAQQTASGRLRFHDNPIDALRDIEVLWIAYDTPVDEDDVADVDFVVSQIERTLPQLAAPCKPGPTPHAGGFSGLLQSFAIDGLDSVACREGITREQLVMNLIRHR